MTSPSRGQAEVNAPGMPEVEPRHGRSLPVLVLAEAHTEVERELLDAWGTATYPGAEIVAADDDRLAALVGSGEALVVPACVTWLPSRGEAGGDSRVSDLILLRDPRRPWAWMQRKIVDRE